MASYRLNTVSSAVLSTAQPASSKAQTSVSTNAFPQVLPTTTKPATSGQSVIAYERMDSMPSLIKVTPYVFANSAVATGMRIVGWTSYTQETGAARGTAFWVPTVLADLTLSYNSTTGSIPSVAVFQEAGDVAYFFSGLAIGGGVASANLYVPGTTAAAGSGVASCVIDTIGSQIVMFQFKTSTGTTMGALWYPI